MRPSGWPADGPAATDTALRNIALEAVKTGNYYAEDQAEVISYIAEIHAELLSDAAFLKKERRKLLKENGLTRLYSVQEILAKKPEVDGYNVFVDADEAVAAFEAAKRGPREGPAELAPGQLAELQENLDEAVAASQGEAAGVGEDELLELLETSAKAGELPAATFCAERLQVLHEDDEMPDAMLERIFAALKPLMRPSARRAVPQLQGPWSESGASAQASTRKFSQLINQLAQARKKLLAKADESVAENLEQSKAAEEAMRKFVSELAPAMVADEALCACNRRGPLTLAIAELCKRNGLPISRALAWDALNALQDIGVVRVQMRQVDVVVDAAAASSPKTTLVGMSALADDLGVLEKVAKERAERRKRRKEAQERGKAAKRGRLE